MYMILAKVEYMQSSTPKCFYQSGGASASQENSSHHEEFSAFPDTRRYMNWAHKLAPENGYLKTCPVSLCLTI